MKSPHVVLYRQDWYSLAEGSGVLGVFGSSCSEYAERLHVASLQMSNVFAFGSA